MSEVGVRQRCSDSRGGLRGPLVLNWFRSELAGDVVRMSVAIPADREGDGRASGRPARSTCPTRRRWQRPSGRPINAGTDAARSRSISRGAIASTAQAPSCWHGSRSARRGRPPHPRDGGRNPEAARLIALYGSRRVGAGRARDDECAGANRHGRRATARQADRRARFHRPLRHRGAEGDPRPGSVDWRSLPALIQEIGANALLVTSAANLLVGVIIGFSASRSSGASVPSPTFPSSWSSHNSVSSDRWSRRSSWPGDRAPVWRRRSPR